MKKMIKILFLLLVCFPFKNVYAVINYTLTHSSKKPFVAVDQIPIPSDTRFINFAYDKSYGVPKFNVNNTHFSSHDANGVSALYLKNAYKNKKNKTKYLQDKTGDNSFTNVASIIIPKIGYYYDYTDLKNDKGKIWLNLKVTVAKVAVNFFGSCSTSYVYKLATFNSDSKKFAAHVRKSKSMGGAETYANNECSINTKLTFKYEFYRVDGGATPSNVTYLWKISDLDQPDDNGNGWSGTYVESIKFGDDKDFHPDFYVFKSDSTSKYNQKGSVLAVDGTKFKGTKQTCADGKINSTCVTGKQTTVYAFQKGPVADVAWWGSRDLGTTLIGTSGFNPRICEPISGGKYYGINGTIVGHNAYIDDCACKDFGNGLYSDDKGTKTKSFDVYKKACFKQCMRDDSGDYYGTEMNVKVSKEEYEAQCLYDYHGHLCSSKTIKEDITCGEMGEINDSASPEYSEADTYGSVTITSKKHTSCKAGSNYEKGNLYQKIDGKDDLILVNSSGAITDYSISRCIPVKINVPFVLTENITFNNLGLASNKIYAGGGFLWNGADVLNTVGWVPRYIRAAKGTKDLDQFRLLFTVNYNNSTLMFRKDAKNGIKSSDETVSTTNLYHDNKCTGAIISEQELIGNITEYIQNTMKVNNVQKLEFTSSTGSNDDELGVKNPTMDLSKTGSSNNTVDGIDISNSLRLKHAYINRFDAKIYYGSKPNDDYLDGGLLYYVPLKYTDPTFSISFKDDSNVSVIGQTDKKISSVCTIDVESIFYEKDEKSGRLKNAFRYRPIKVNDTFNGESKEKIAEHAQNWAQWYCDANGNCGNTTNRGRIENTYDSCNNTNESGKCNNPLYRISFDSDAISNIRRVSNGLAYNDLSSINVNGTSSFVTEKNGFDIIASNESYCKLGGFNASKCDKKRSGGS